MGLCRAVVAVSVLTCVFMLVPSGEAQGFGSTCKYEDFFGRTQYYTCPRKGDDPKNKYCCGDDKTQTCCDKLLGIFDDETVKNLAENPTAMELSVKKGIKGAGAIIGIVVSIILFVIIAVFVCCCCCSCCFLSKMRQRRTARNAHSTAAVPLNQTAAGYPTHQQPQQQHHQQPQYQQNQQQPQYQNQHQQPQYQNHQQPYPDAQQSYHGGNGPYPANPSYPSAYGGAPYPGGQAPYPMPDHPPPYADFEKQPPYNPNYQA